MSLTTKIVVVAGALCLIFGIGAGSFAEDTASDAASKYVSNNVTITGYGSYEFGEVVKGNNAGLDIDHYWSHQVYAGMGFMAALGPTIELVAGIEGKMWNPYPNTDLPGRSQFTTGYSLWLTGVYGTYSPFGGEGHSWLQLTAGYFPFKYNPDVRNLGEYVFRSFTYPGLLMNYFDFPAVRLLGLNLHANLFDDFFSGFDSKLKSNLLITEEDQNWPIGDISVSLFASLNIKKIFELGGGIDFANCISMNSFNTTPTWYNSSNGGNAIVESQDALGTKSWDSTQFYSFKAIKPMARLNIDPKPLMGGIGQIFGQEDLKLYGEACIIGLQDYSYYYANMSERTPIMVGFNVPTFKILDVLNLEAEYNSSRLLTSYQNQVQPTGALNRIFVVPLPAGMVDYIPDFLRWKWSVYLKKTLSPRVSLILQCAQDHFRLNYPDGNPVYNETLTQHGNWRWVAKLVGNL